MNTHPVVANWSPGDLAVLADGDYAGMAIKVWSVNPVEGTAVVSLQVFSKNRPFEIELSRLLKPAHMLPQWVRANLYALLALVSGPILVLLILTIDDLVSGRPQLAAFSWSGWGYAGVFGLLGSTLPAFGIFLAIIWQKDQRAK